MSLLDLFRDKAFLMCDERPYLDAQNIQFLFRQREVGLTSNSILIDTGAKFCVLDRRTIANLLHIDHSLLADYLSSLSILPQPYQSKEVPYFGLPFKRPQYLIGFSGIECWTISLPGVEIIINKKFPILVLYLPVIMPDRYSACLS